MGSKRGQAPRGSLRRRGHPRPWPSHRLLRPLPAKDSAEPPWRSPRRSSAGPGCGRASIARGGMAARPAKGQAAARGGKAASHACGGRRGSQSCGRAVAQREAAGQGTRRPALTGPGPCGLGSGALRGRAPGSAGRGESRAVSGSFRPKPPPIAERAGRLARTVGMGLGDDVTGAGQRAAGLCPGGKAAGPPPALGGGWFSGS